MFFFCFHAFGRYGCRKPVCAIRRPWVLLSGTLLAKSCGDPEVPIMTPAHGLAGATFAVFGTHRRAIMVPRMYCLGFFWGTVSEGRTPLNEFDTLLLGKSITFRRFSASPPHFGPPPPHPLDGGHKTSPATPRTPVTCFVAAFGKSFDTLLAKPYVL